MVLFATGSNLFVSSLCGRYFRWLFRLFSFIVIAYCFKFTVTQCMANGLSLISIESFSFSCGFMLANIILILRTTRSELLLRNLVSSIPPAKLSSLYKKIILLIILMNVFRVMELAIGDSLSSELGYKSKHSSQTVVDLVSDAAEFVVEPFMDWPLTTTSFYWIAANILMLYKNQISTCLQQKLTMNRYDFLNVMRAVKDITTAHSEFESLYSFLPFLWLLDGILSTPGNLNFLRHSYNTRNISHAFKTVRYATPAFVVICWIFKSHESLCETIDQIEGMIAICDKMAFSEKSFVIRELDKLRRLKLTGMSFFNLDRSFIMSYTGTVFTFAALIASYATTDQGVLAS